MRSTCGFPSVGVLVLSQYVETHHAVRLLEAGPEAVGYLLKDRVADVGELADGVRRVAGGGSAIDPEVVSQLIRRRRVDDPIERLTERERETVSLMAEGRSNQATSERLFLSPKTSRLTSAISSTSLSCFPPPTIIAGCSRWSPICEPPEELADLT